MDKAVFRYLAEACKRLDHEEFGLQTLAHFHGFSTVSDWAEMIKSWGKKMDSACLEGFERPEEYLKDNYGCVLWAEADTVFNQSMDRNRYGPQSESVVVADALVKDLASYSGENSVLIADLLPELVELKKFDPQMKAVLRKKWSSLDAIMAGWFRGDRNDRCGVPHW